MTEEKKTNEGVQRARRPYRRAFKKNVEQKTNQEVAIDVNIEKKADTRTPRKKTSRTAEVKRENKRNTARNMRVTSQESKESKESKEIKIVKTVEKSHKNIKVARDRLKIIPLGGLEEVGKNMTVFEYGDDMILVDCGVAFPEDDMLGVDLVIPDFAYLTKNK